MVLQHAPVGIVSGNGMLCVSGKTVYYVLCVGCGCINQPGESQLSMYVWVVTWYVVIASVQQFGNVMT